MLGTDPKQIAINDLAVNPRSGNVYLSVSRGRGPDAMPVIVRINADGKLEELALENVRFAKAEIPNAPGAKQPRQRNESITDLAYVDGRVFLAGLSNEEFSSRLIAIPFPFSSEGIDGAAIEIYHGAHGQFETKSPIRTFVTYRIQNEPYMLAAYTCTPLVKVPVCRAQGRRPRQGNDHRRAGQPQPPARHDRLPEGRQGLSADDQQQPRRDEDPHRGRRHGRAITEPVRWRQKGLGYDTIASLKGVVQMDQLDDRHAVILVKTTQADRWTSRRSNCRDRPALASCCLSWQPGRFPRRGNRPGRRAPSRRHCRRGRRR